MPLPVLSAGASQMELTLDPGHQDLLDFLLEESGGLGAPADPSVEAPLDWDLHLSDVGGGRERQGGMCGGGCGGGRHPDSRRW